MYINDKFARLHSFTATGDFDNPKIGLIRNFDDRFFHILILFAD